MQIREVEIPDLLQPFPIQNFEAAAPEGDEPVPSQLLEHAMTCAKQQPKTGARLCPRGAPAASPPVLSGRRGGLFLGDYVRREIEAFARKAVQMGVETEQLSSFCARRPRRLARRPGISPNRASRFAGLITSWAKACQGPRELTIALIEAAS